MKRTPADAIAEVRGLIAELDGELRRMPAFKVNTARHTDRVRSREGLASRLERLLAWQAEIALSN